MTERWPELDYEADRPVIKSLRAYPQFGQSAPRPSLGRRMPLDEMRR